MAEEKTFEKEELDAAIEKAIGPLKESVGNLESKRDELIAENRKLKRGAEIKPEDLAAAEERADKAEARAKELEGNVKSLTKERDNAVKSLETEQGAARSYALDAEINAAIASGNVVAALVPAFTAMVKQNAKADLVDGKYAVMIGDKPAKDHITAFLNSEDGKHFKAAAVNGGGGAGGGSEKSSGKTISRDQFNTMSASDQMAFSKEGGKVVDAAA